MDYNSFGIEAFHLDTFRTIAGLDHQHFKLLEEAFSVTLTLHNNEIRIEGNGAYHVEHVFELLFPYIEDHPNFETRDFLYVIALEEQGRLEEFRALEKKVIGRTHDGRIITPKTVGQQMMCKKMEQNDIVFASGVAGTGKTYLAVVNAITDLKKGHVERIILTRPAVEAGENLGFLPGDLKEKVDPYLRPLYDALYDMLGATIVDRYIEKGVIEVAPLAYMRGRTLERAFVILDEAQNTTKSQMKMFLTRMGFHSKIVITGDTSQVDLPAKKDSGLMDALQTLQGIDGIGFVNLSSLDVVRHPLVQKIIDRYEEKESKYAKNIVD